jgi:hypothetical protein
MHRKFGLAPSYYDELKKSGIISEEVYGMKFYEDLQDWVNRKFHQNKPYCSNQYPQKLLVKSSTNPMHNRKQTINFRLSLP